jgi:hypothetical protein
LATLLSIFVLGCHRQASEMAEKAESARGSRE